MSSRRYRFDLEKALAVWRRSLTFNRAFSADDLDELESHLRDAVADAVAAGASEEAAFAAALSQMGAHGAAEAEYRKVYWRKAARAGRLADEVRWRLTMLKSYGLAAWRHAKRHTGYVALNVFGLSIGIACCVLILLYVRHELSYDRFHANADRVYRIATEVAEAGVIQRYTYTPLPLVAALDEVPGVDTIATISGPRRLRVQRDDGPFYQDGIAWASASVFDVFTLPLLQGDSETALVDPFSVVLTEALARKLFGDAEPMGQTLTIGDDPYTVTGVLAPIPAASHWRFTALRSESTQWAERSPDYRTWALSQWTNYVHTYLLLPNGASPSAIETDLAALAGRLREGEGPATYHFELQPLTDIHLHSDLRGELGPPGDAGLLYVLAGVALLILLVACINFMNLATARAAQRAREVGVRKVVGARRGQLVGQFLGEAMLTSGFALAVALLWIAGLRPAFEDLVGVDLELGLRIWGIALAGAGAVALLAGLVGGSYPALALSAFLPVEALRGRPGTPRHGTLRKGLVVAQFAVSATFLIGTLVVFSQLDYARHKDLGFTSEHVLTFDFHDASQYRTFKQELLSHPGILNVTASMGTPGVWAPENAFDPTPADGAGALAYHWLGVDPDFAETYEVEVVEGRDLDAAFPSDATDAFLLNETAVQALGWEDPIGRRIRLDLNDRTGTVVGVVKDFHHGSLHEPIAPLLLYVVDDVFLSTVSVRIRPGDVAGTLAFLQATWEKFQPDHPLEARFLDEAFAALYEADGRFAQLCGYVSLLALLVACLGLFGLAAFSAAQRTKEIGIRKALGASAASIVGLLSGEFLKLVAVAFLIAAPLAWLAMERWLEAFAYRIDLGPGVFALAGGLVLLIALATVSVQAVRAARADPVQSLRYE